LISHVADLLVALALSRWSFRRRSIAQLNKNYSQDVSASFGEVVPGSTCITQAVAETTFGKFQFDIRDIVIGWQIARLGVWEKVESELVASLLERVIIESWGQRIF